MYIDKNNLSGTCIIFRLVSLILSVVFSMPDSNAVISKHYQQLWAGLTKHAVKPAIESHMQESGSKVDSRRKQKGGRRLSTRSNQDLFVSDWTQSIQSVVQKNTRSVGQKKQKKRISKKSAKKRGGFIRDGSVQYFPSPANCDDSSK